MALGRMQLPIDIGRLAVFLAGPDSSYLAGAVIRADGGQFIEGGASWIDMGDHAAKNTPDSDPSTTAQL